MATDAVTAATAGAANNAGQTPCASAADAADALRKGKSDRVTRLHRPRVALAVDRERQRYRDDDRAGRHAARHVDIVAFGEADHGGHAGRAHGLVAAAEEAGDRARPRAPSGRR